jgi:putative spermidine/putrescine transport system permease protein
MSSIATTDNVMRTADGTLLRTKLRQAERVRQLKAIGLVAPLFLFILLSFAAPIANMLYYSVDNPELVQTMPRTAEFLKTWDGSELPGEDGFEA